MSNDLEVINKLEKKIGNKLIQLSIGDIKRFNNGYSIDENQIIIGLNLCELRISDISFLRELKNLTHLYLHNNQISDISYLKDLKNLISLNLSENKISDISSLKYLKNLTGLSLSSNYISNILFIEDLKNLFWLDLSSNEISDISPLQNLRNLTHLYLHDNRITDISYIKDLKNLKKVDLTNNRISYLPTEVLDLNIDVKWAYDSHGGIFLKGNLFKRPPVEIRRRGGEAVKTYLRSLTGKKRSLNEVKLLFVGDGGAGKTSLIKHLLGEKFNANEEQTHGINIEHWQVKPGKIKIKVNIWDFGGQEIMHATHQFFLSKRSLYVLVLDGRKDEKVEYWLKHIESFGGDSPILVVINKIDQNPGFDVNRIFLQGKYKNIKGFCRVSCAKGTGIDEFSQHLLEELVKVELIDTTWAETWFRVKIGLETMTKDFISYNEYKTMCEKKGIKDKVSQDTLVDFLHDLGVVLHFKDFKLEEIHVLEPEWITTGVYKIINSPLTAASKGLLKLNLLDKILKQEKETDFFYPRDKYRFIIDLMQKFELCFEVDSDTILIPDLLEIRQPKFNFHYETALKFVIQYDFLPRSVMPRFIVKMHKDIKEGLHWRTGVMLEDQAFKSTSVVVSDNEERKISIFVQGDQKRDYLSVILFSLREINNSFEKLQAVEKVPMPDDPEITVSYEHLIRLEKKGKTEYMPDGSEKEYNVKDLLGTVQTEKKSEEEILKILQKLMDKQDTIETLLKKAEGVFQIKPNFFGMGIDLKNLAKKVFGDKGSRH